MMKTHSVPDHVTNVCEIVLPIVLEIPIQVEPVVLELPPTCDTPVTATMGEAVQPAVSASACKQAKPRLHLKERLMRLVMAIKVFGWFRWFQLLFHSDSHPQQGAGESESLPVVNL